MNADAVPGAVPLEGATDDPGVDPGQDVQNVQKGPVLKRQILDLLEADVFVDLRIDRLDDRGLSEHGDLTADLGAELERVVMPLNASYPNGQFDDSRHGIGFHIHRQAIVCGWEVGEVVEPLRVGGCGTRLIDAGVLEGDRCALHWLAGYVGDVTQDLAGRAELSLGWNRAEQQCRHQCPSKGVGGQSREFLGSKHLGFSLFYGLCVPASPA